jgi:hypothetical protein
MTTRLLTGLIVLAAGALGGSGCLVLSLHPVYDDTSIVYDEGLLGAWRNEEDRALVTIRPAEWRSYTITYQDATEEEALTGYLTTIGGERFLDVAPQRGRDRGPFLVPAHGLFRLRQSGDTITVEALNYDWFSKILASRRPGLPPAAVDERENVVVTVPTPRLRAWVLQHLKSPQAFGPPATFHRQPEAKAESPALPRRLR